MKHSINRIKEYVAILSGGFEIEVRVYDSIHSQASFDSVANELKRERVDFFVAMDSAASNVFLSFVKHSAMNTPGIALGYADVIAGDVPPFIEAFSPPCNIEKNLSALAGICPQVRHLLFVGGHATLDRHSLVWDLYKECVKKGIVVDKVYVDGADSVKEQIDLFASRGAEAVCLMYDGVVFAHMQDVIKFSRHHDMLVIASGIHSIHAGADVAMGYSETRIFKLLAQKIVGILRHERQKTKMITGLDFEVHCNVGKLSRFPQVMENVGRLFKASDASGLSLHIHADKEARR
ncbi:MAG: hypothetical protein PVJ92_01175 [Candidatus Dependentiae bacterium]